MYNESKEFIIVATPGSARHANHLVATNKAVLEHIDNHENVSIFHIPQHFISVQNAQEFKVRLDELMERFSDVIVGKPKIAIIHELPYNVAEELKGILDDNFALFYRQEEEQIVITDKPYMVLTSGTLYGTSAKIAKQLARFEFLKGHHAQMKNIISPKVDMGLLTAERYAAKLGEILRLHSDCPGTPIVEHNRPDGEIPQLLISFPNVLFVKRSMNGVLINIRNTLIEEVR